MNAAAWFYSQSFAGRMEDPKPERTGPKVGEKSTVDRWDAKHKCWREVVLTWDGEKYVKIEVGRQS